MTRSHVGRDVFICGTWLIYTCNWTHLYVGHDSFGANLNAAETNEACPTYDTHHPHSCGAHPITAGMDESCPAYETHLCGAHH